MTISIKTQNKKGNSPQYKENLSYVTTFLRHDSDKIIIDSFKGQGDSYKEREQLLITFVMNDKIIFKGTKQELEKTICDSLCLDENR